jgi:hypothetical protein
VFHSDRGSQYAAKDYRAALEVAGITCSMSRRGNCWDNAVAESFFATLKTELVHDANFISRESAKTTIAETIAVGHDGSGTGAPAVIRALTRALTVAELLRMQGVQPRRALDVPLRFDDLPRGLASVVRDAWAFEVGLDEDGEVGTA